MMGQMCQVDGKGHPQDRLIGGNLGWERPHAPAWPRGERPRRLGINHARPSSPRPSTNTQGMGLPGASAVEVWAGQQRETPGHK